MEVVMLEVVVGTVAWIWASTCRYLPLTYPWLESLCVRTIDFGDLQTHLSNRAEVHFPNSSEFPILTARWSTLDVPNPNLVVVPGTEDDVAETIKYANKKHFPFLTYNGAHGALTTLGHMSHGIGINLERLTSVTIGADGETATIGGGTSSYTVITKLWELGKQTVTGTCECVSYLGPGLGGGHGWLQGHHGLIADQFVSMNIVLADGRLERIDASSDLWWAMKGAGHNFGIVTSVETKIYDIKNPDWAVETLIFSGKQVEAVYEAANVYLLKNGSQPADVINWSYWLNIPPLDPDNPVIIFYIIQEGVTAVDPAYKKPFYELNPLSAEPGRGTYLDLAAWTGIDISAMPCQKLGHANPRFPIYLESYDTNAQKKAYDVFANAVRGSSPFNNSMFQFEGYPTTGIRKTSSDETAFAYRNEKLLVAPMINYVSDGSKLDRQAADLGNNLRRILHEATDRQDLHSYVNYAYGNEKPEELYGKESWRQDRLQDLKRKYDPKGRFSYYAPIA